MFFFIQMSNDYNMEQKNTALSDLLLNMHYKYNKQSILN